MGDENKATEHEDQDPSPRLNHITSLCQEAQAAIGSVALDRVRSHGEQQLEDYRMDVLTGAFWAILITAPIGSILTGLLGPRLLPKVEHQNKDEEV